MVPQREIAGRVTPPAQKAAASPPWRPCLPFCHRYGSVVAYVTPLPM